MAKIKITESELRQLIGESVQSVLEAYDDRMGRRNERYQNAQAAYDKYTKNWEDLTPDEKDAWNQKAGAGWTGEALYNNERNTAKTKLRRMTRRNGQQFKNDLDAANQQNTDLQSQITNLQNQVASLNNDKAQLDAELKQFHGAIGSNGNMNVALKTIGKWKQNSIALAKLQKQQTAGQNQTPAQQTGARQQAPAKPQTMMAESEDEGIGDTVRTAAQKVKNTMGKAKQTAKNALKNWQGKRDAHDKMMAQQNQARTALANNQINRF